MSTRKISFEIDEELAKKLDKIKKKTGQTEQQLFEKKIESLYTFILIKEPTININRSNKTWIYKGNPKRIVRFEKEE